MRQLSNTFLLSCVAGTLVVAVSSVWLSIQAKNAVSPNASVGNTFLRASGYTDISGGDILYAASIACDRFEVPRKYSAINPQGLRTRPIVCIDREGRASFSRLEMNAN